METSFIPKKNYKEKAVNTKYTSWFLVIATFIFAASAIFAGGVFFYKGFLESEIKNKNTILERERGGLDLALIQKLSKFDKKIEVAKELLDDHIALSYLFNFLEANTLKEVMFNNLNFEVTKDGYQLILEGRANSYADVAVQSNVLSSNKNILEPIFSDLRVNSNGDIVFKASMKMDPKLISYKDNLEVE
ncbi:MAG: hypothetical protein KAJ58_00820 [Candidatus Pacebacteria bacterium]|nr:hypothetical protein [Candidatus Paceibacterota bacterium]